MGGGERRGLSAPAIEDSALPLVPAALPGRMESFDARFYLSEPRLQRIPEQPVPCTTPNGIGFSTRASEVALDLVTLDEQLLR